VIINHDAGSDLPVIPRLPANKRGKVIVKRSFSKLKYTKIRKFTNWFVVLMQIIENCNENWQKIRVVTHVTWVKHIKWNGSVCFVYAGVGCAGDETGNQKTPTDIDFLIKISFINTSSLLKQ